MAQIHVDPDELEKFTNYLRRFNGELSTSLNQLQAQFVRVGDTWRDQEHQKYAQEFEQTMRLLRQFTRSTEQQIPLLQAKINTLRKY